MVRSQFGDRLSFMVRRFFIIFAGLIAIAGVSMPQAARANPLYASFVMDADTGKVLHERYADKKLHPASLTKVMTLLMVFEALQKGKLRMDERIYISHHAASMVPSKLGLKPGESIAVRDAISALATKSANDIAVAVAEHLGGSERNFARMMTIRARQLGMNRTLFMNASGLNHKKQVSTARDMAMMARYVITQYPRYYRFFGKKSFKYDGKIYRNHNRLMNTYAGMDGMKTGYISASGFNLIASAVRNDRRVIGVVFGGKTSKSRNAHMARLLDDAFRRLPQVRVASAIIPTPRKKPDMMQLAANVVADIAPAAGRYGDVVRFIPAPAAKADIRINLIEQGSADFQGDIDKSWAIQVGAFKTQQQTMHALRKAVKQLPPYYKRAEPTVVPLEIAGANLYRARLSGYSAHEAYAACAYIRECITIAP